LHVAAQKGNLDVVRFMVKELRADVNQLTRDGLTQPFMLAARNEHEGVVTLLIKYGAHVKDSTDAYGTAADISKRGGAPAEQTQYLEAGTHCAKPECDGATKATQG
jgi:ankyrin repeat protein